MAQVKLLKIDADGVPVEFSSTDDITLNSYTVQGGGPVLSPTGLDMNGQDISDLSDLVFTDPSVGTINQTAGSLVIDNIMAKERNNIMTTSGAILFPTITDTAGQVDSFKVPNIAGVPSATPTFSATAGYLAYDSSNKNMYVWDGSAWDNMNTVSSTQNVDDLYTAATAISARDLVYISAADSVSPAVNTAPLSSQTIGFAVASASSAASVSVRKIGRLSGFSALTSGARYFLGDTDGAITSSVPTTSGASVIMVGYAKNATTIDIMFDSLGRRA